MIVTKGKPDWLTIQVNLKEEFEDVKRALKKEGLVTVCEESHCPNKAECWNGGTATFMVLGDTCTRGCKFCNVKTALKGMPVDKKEPEKIRKVVEEWGLDYVVLTSVDRDDLEDQGAKHFAECIKELKKINVFVEVLIPDFQGREDLLKIITEAKPDVIAHNIETIKRLQPKVRDLRANYEQSLKVLENVKKINPKIFTKTSIMAGHGETEEEIQEAMNDLRKIKVDFLTLGQYLRPTKKHIPIKEFVTPEQFKKYEIMGKNTGFKYVASGPFVRSSYKAGELFVKNMLKKRDVKLQT